MSMAVTVVPDEPPVEEGLPRECPDPEKATTLGFGGGL